MPQLSTGDIDVPALKEFDTHLPFQVPESLGAILRRSIKFCFSLSHHLLCPLRTTVSMCSGQYYVRFQVINSVTFLL